MPNDLTQFLRVGQQALIHLETGGPDQCRSSTTIRGWVAGASLLLDTPMQQGMPISLERGGPCTVRCLVDGTAVGFSSVVAEAGRTQPIFRITWPAKVEYVAIRKHQRMKLHAPCTMRLPEGEPFDVELRDLSVGGCRLFARRSAKAGSDLQISLHLFSDRALGPIPAVVRNESVSRDGFLLGCQFTQLDAVSQLEIECFLSARPDAIRAGKKYTSRAVIFSRNPEFIETMRRLLAAVECELVAAPSAVDGFHALRLAPAHLVLAQYDLPELAGPAICRVAHAALGLEKVPVILFGGKPTDEGAAKEAGAYHFFPIGTKPGVISDTAREALASTSSRERETA